MCLLKTKLGEPEVGLTVIVLTSGGQWCTVSDPGCLVVMQC